MDVPAAYYYFLGAGPDGRTYFSMDSLGIKVTDGADGLADTNVTEGTYRAAGTGSDGKTYFLGNSGIRVLDDATGDIADTNVTAGTYRAVGIGSDGRTYFCGDAGIKVLDEATGDIADTNVTAGEWRTVCTDAYGRTYFAGTGIKVLNGSVISDTNVISGIYTFAGVASDGRAYFSGSSIGVKVAGRSGSIADTNITSGSISAMAVTPEGRTYVTDSPGGLLELSITYLHERFVRTEGRWVDLAYATKRKEGFRLVEAVRGMQFESGKSLFFDTSVTPVFVAGQTQVVFSNNLRTTYRFIISGSSREIAIYDDAYYRLKVIYSGGRWLADSYPLGYSERISEVQSLDNYTELLNSITVGSVADVEVDSKYLYEEAIPDGIAWHDTSRVAHRDLRAEVALLKAPKGYSTSAEQLTGEAWTDGKVIYRRTVDCGALPDSGAKRVASGIAGAGTIVRLEGTAYDAAVCFALPYAGAAAADGIGMSYARGTDEIELVAGQDRSALSAWVTVYYTKS
jgi:hypothetical protein